MMEKTKTKQQLSKELNGLLNMNVAWTVLKRSDLEQIHRFLLEEMTLPRALNLNTTSLRLKLESMPLVQILREQGQIVRRDYQKSHPHVETVRYHQQPGIPTVLQVQKALPTQPEKQKRIQYIS